MKIKLKNKRYLKVNLMTLLFMVISFISVTLAWFAYSGLTNTTTDIGVKAWYIELEKDGQVVSNDVVISLPDIYPGMDPVTETINIKNLGDADAAVSYNIVSARILDQAEDNYVIDETVTSNQVEDIISHNYPFHININLSKNYVLTGGSPSSFKVSVSWPLDSDDNTFDSLWGQKAYTFQQSEQDKQIADPEYQIKTPIRITISLAAEQYLGEPDDSDPEFNLGDTILYDVVSNDLCSTISATCLKTYVLDPNNRMSDTNVSLLPEPKDTYLENTFANYSSTISSITTSWTVNKRSLTINDLINITSTDILNSVLVRPSISDAIIGNLSYGTRLNTELTKAVSYSGYYRFNNDKFAYLAADNCYWTNTEYNPSNGFAIKQVDLNYSKIYPELKNTTCNVVPVIVADKVNLEE